MSMHERKYLRIPPSPQNPLVVMIGQEHFQKTLPKIKVLDIGIGGISCETPRGGSFLQMGMQIQMNLYIPEEDVCVMSGMVSYISGVKCGIEFIQKEDKEIAKIARYVQRREVELLNRNEFNRVPPSREAPVRATFMLSSGRQNAQLLEIGVDSITMDISEEVGKALKEGMWLDGIEIALPDEEICIISGRVGTVKEKRCEVNFSDVKRFELSKIKRYICKREIEQQDHSAVREDRAPAKIKEQTECAKTILIVDDSPIFQELYSKAFLACGYVVLQAKDGSEGIKVAVGACPDLILMDINMPVLNGIETTRIIKAHPRTRHIPIIMFTTEGEKSAVVRAMQVGANDYLIKSVEKDAVIKRIDIFFEKKDSQP